MNRFVDVPKVIGTKQTLKAVKDGKALKVFLAEDTEERIKKSIVDCCSEYNVTVESFETKIGLGRAGGIDRGAAVITIVK